LDLLISPSWGKLGDIESKKNTMNYTIRWYKDGKYAVHPEMDEKDISFIGSLAECKGWIYNKTGNRFDSSPLDQRTDWVENARPKSKRVIETGVLLSSYIHNGVASASDVRRSFFGHNDSPRRSSIASMKESILKSLRDKRRKLREEEEFFVLTGMIFYVDELQKTRNDIRRIEHQLWLFEWEQLNSGYIAPKWIDLVVLGELPVSSHTIQATKLPIMTFEDSEPVLPWAIT
jgi:hypothetical protein